ncbi:MAG TPA: alkaline phosphatase [Vicinamibacterales bacterium]|jgi:alkaline phosphatase/streptomycin-6-phosphatase
MPLPSHQQRAAWLAAALVTALASTAAGQRPAAPDADRPVRKILLFIGDGMGDSEITIARNYSVGASGRLAMDTLPYSGAYTTFSVEEHNPALPDYVPDSAATGTAWATGRKTSNGRISTAPGTNRPLETILEIAIARGWRTGDVTTAELTDATPAVLGAHVAHRSCQGPEDMRSCPSDLQTAGGRGSIAEQLVAHRIDVLLGGGAARFDQRTPGGRTVAELARADGYEVVRTREALAAAPGGNRLLGLFAPRNMSIDWQGEEALPYPANIASPQVCRTGNANASEPTLADMTTKALQLLDAGNPNAAFLLQVEGASIDKQDHAANPCGQIGETVAFDRAIGVGLEYAQRHPDTLVIVTADHANTSQIVSRPTDTSHPTGMISALRTSEGAVMYVSYGTNVFHRMQDHTGSQVRIAAAGPSAAQVSGLLDQTDLFKIMRRAIESSPVNRPRSER